MTSMGIYFSDVCIKRKFRWTLEIPGVSSHGNVSLLPPEKAARPSLTFKEMEAQHLNETIFFPSKPDWKPITITLVDIQTKGHPVNDWINVVYNPFTGAWKPVINGGTRFKKDQVTINMLDGCGNLMESWVYENAYPQTCEFGELDMTDTGIMYIDLTLRYDRAYIKP